MHPFLDLNLKEPLLQAPMGGVQDHRLALAVCRGAPYNINFFCHTPPADPEPGVLQARHALLTPLWAVAERQGVADYSPLWAGQNTQGCKTCSATALTEELMQGFSA